jgi:hypothetical protein
MVMVLLIFVVCQEAVPKMIHHAQRMQFGHRMFRSDGIFANLKLYIDIVQLWTLVFNI